MSVQPSRTPSYRLHKPTGQAVVTAGGRDLYLGKFETPREPGRIRSAHCRVVGQRPDASRRRRLRQRVRSLRQRIALGVLDMGRVVLPQGMASHDGAGTTSGMRSGLSANSTAMTLARDFGPLQLKTVRQAIIDSGICRNEVNRRVRHHRPGVQVGRGGGNGPSLRPSRPPSGLRPPSGPLRRPGVGAGQAGPGCVR